MVAKLTLGICQRVAQRAANQCVSGLYGAIARNSLIAVFAVLMPLQDAQHVHAASQNLYDAKTGYRIKHYRSAVPTDVPGGTLVDIDTVDALRTNDNAILIDVMPATGFGYSPKTGKWRLSQVHDHIEGSAWLPDVGRGHITDELETYFKSNLDRLTNGNKAQPLIIYCQSDCWMAWNAVQRAAKYGYTKLYWYPDGIDGWRDYDRELIPAKAIPVDVIKSKTK